jgi:hypothetical protein
MVFTRECRKLWREAHTDLRQRVIDGVEKLERKKNGERESSGKENSESRGKESASASATSSSGNGGKSNNTARFELLVLNELSLRRLKEWVEEDEDSKLEEVKRKLLEKSNEAKKIHSQFVRKKDGLRIRLPDPSEMPAMTIPRMDYTKKAEGTVRPKSDVLAKSTVDMLGQSGLKYAYAQSKGRWVNMGDSRVYIEGDLDRSRRKLLDLGIVYKENFDAEEDSKFHLDSYNGEKRENVALRERREREEKGKEDSSKAFNEWIQLKSFRDQVFLYSPFPSISLFLLLSPSLSLLFTPLSLSFSLTLSFSFSLFHLGFKVSGSLTVPGFKGRK